MNKNLKTKNLEDPYLKYLKSKTFNKKFLENCDFLLPQFFLKNIKDIQTYYKVKLTFQNYEQSYHNLKIFLKNNEEYLLNNVNNLDLDLSIKQNILFSKFGKNIKTTYKSLNLFQEKKYIILGLKEYKDKKNLYTSVNSSLFIKILNDFMKTDERYIFVKFYNYFSDIKQNLLKHKNIIGILSYEPLFNIGPSNFTKSNKNKNNTKYIFLNNNSNNKNKTSSININSFFNQYKKFYEPYNYKRYLKKIENIVINNYKQYAQLSEKLDSRQFKNLYELLNMVIDMEFYLTQILLHYQLLFNLEMLFKQDAQIKNYIMRNMINFETFSGSFASTFSNNSSSSKSLNVPSYTFNKIFNKTN